MELTLESGRIIPQASESDLRLIEGEDFAILAAGDSTYMQCAEPSEPPYDYILEYRAGSQDQHYQAVDGPIDFERILAAFTKYLRNDSSWLSDFRWERLEL